MKSFYYHTDPGHGWLAVKRSLLITLGILDQITSYSYQRGNTVYLEEDQDMNTFMKAYEKQFNMTPGRIERHRDNSPIRYFDCFRK